MISHVGQKDFTPKKVLLDGVETPETYMADEENGIAFVMMKQSSPDESNNFHKRSFTRMICADIGRPDIDSPILYIFRGKVEIKDFE